MKLYLYFFLCLCLTACNGFKEKLGLVRSVPNEFQTIKHEPLIIPETLQVPPPEKARRKKQTTSEDKAKTILGISAPMVESSGHTSEEALLKKVGAQKRDRDIRDNLAPPSEEETLQDKIQKTLVFWKKPKKKGHVINPEQEMKTLKKEKK